MEKNREQRIQHLPGRGKVELATSSSEQNVNFVVRNLQHFIVLDSRIPSTESSPRLAIVTLGSAALIIPSVFTLKGTDVADSCSVERFNVGF